MLVNLVPLAFSYEFLQDSGAISEYAVFCSFTSISVRIWELLHRVLQVHSILTGSAVFLETQCFIKH